MAKKHKVDHGGGGVNLGLIITPMLDMAFQILSFFIMTYNPSALEGHIPGSLVPPSTVAMKGKDNKMEAETPTSVSEEDLTPELEQAVQVKVKAVPKGQTEKDRREGEMTQILVKEAADANFQVIADSDSAVDQAVALLEKHLKQITGDKANVKIEGDGDLRQKYAMLVYDACKKAGFTKVHFVPPPLLREVK
jgi:biopolymer transport protein ExbD